MRGDSSKKGMFLNVWDGMRQGFGEKLQQLYNNSLELDFLFCVSS
jgi:hypothetical protein